VTTLTSALKRPTPCDSESYITVISSPGRSSSLLPEVEPTPTANGPVKVPLSTLVSVSSVVASTEPLEVDVALDRTTSRLVGSKFASSSSTIMVMKPALTVVVSSFVT